MKIKVTPSLKKAVTNLNAGQFSRAQTVGFLFAYFFLVIIVFFWFFPGFGFISGSFLEGVSLYLCFLMDRGVKTPNINFLVRYAYSGFVVSLRIYPASFILLFIFRASPPIQGVRADMLLLYSAVIYALIERLRLHRGVVSRHVSTPWEWHITPQTFKSFRQEFTEALRHRRGIDERQWAPDDLHCPHCRGLIKATDRLCPHCGGKLGTAVRTCPACGGPVSRFIKICPLCNAKLTAPPDAAPHFPAAERRKPEAQPPKTRPVREGREGFPETKKPIIIGPPRDQPVVEVIERPFTDNAEAEDLLAEPAGYLWPTEKTASENGWASSDSEISVPADKPVPVLPADTTPAPDYRTREAPAGNVTPPPIRDRLSEIPAVTTAPDYGSDQRIDERLSPSVLTAGQTSESRGLKKRKEKICRTCGHFDETSESCRNGVRPVYDGYCFHHT